MIHIYINLTSNINWPTQQMTSIRPKANEVVATDAKCKVGQHQITTNHKSYKLRLILEMYSIIHSPRDENENSSAQHLQPSISYNNKASLKLSKAPLLSKWTKLKKILQSTILALQLQNFVSCGRACPSQMTQNCVIVEAKLKTGEWLSLDP